MTDELKTLSPRLVTVSFTVVRNTPQSVVVTDEVVKGIEDAAEFAPLHNPAHLIGIREAFKTFPHLKDKNVVVFDTAFHQTMPEEAYLICTSILTLQRTRRTSLRCTRYQSLLRFS